MAGKSLRLNLHPKTLRWARKRVALDPEELAKKVGVKSARVFEWEKSGAISFHQVEKVALHTRTPVGFLYLSEPPKDELPIPDLRTIEDKALKTPSPDLLATVFDMQRRQQWMHDELVDAGTGPLEFVGSTDQRQSPVKVAAEIRRTLSLGEDWTDHETSWTAALKTLREHIEDAGVMPVFNGVVGNNNHRKLNPKEFRGFALIDDYAPLIFVNSGDFKATQMFSLVHELAHVWLGAEGVSNFEQMQPMPIKSEKFCNAIAAEFLVPTQRLEQQWDEIQEYPDPYRETARRFRVSILVAARRALDTELIDQGEFSRFYREYARDEHRRKQDVGSGGDFWNNQNVRVGRRFGKAVVRAAKEGRLLYRDAYLLTGLHGKTFDNFAKRMGE